MKLDNIKKFKIKPSGLKKIMNSGKVIWKSIYLAQDSDFVWTEVYDEYNWTYSGTETELELPKTILGQAITSYARMFYETKHQSLKIVSDNKNITDMYEMFFSCNNLEILDLSEFYIPPNARLVLMFLGSNKLRTVYVRNQEDVDRLKNDADAPRKINFIVKN